MLPLIPFLMLSLMQPDSVPDHVAMILEINGTVKLHPASGKERPAKISDMLRPGDRLVSEEKAHVLVIFVSNGMREHLKGKARATLGKAACECDPAAARTQIPAPKTYKAPKDELGPRGAGAAFVLNQLDSHMKGFVPECMALGALKPQLDAGTGEMSFKVVDFEKLKRASRGFPLFFSERLQESLFEHALLTNEEGLAIFFLQEQAIKEKRADAYLAFLSGRIAERRQDLTKATAEYARAMELDHDPNWRAGCASRILRNSLLSHRYEEAIAAYTSSLKIRNVTRGATTDLEALADLDDLATLYMIERKYADAEEYYRKALRIREERLGRNNRQVARNLNDLAFLYSVQGLYAKAEPKYLEALRIRETTLAKHHVDVVASLTNLAGVFESQGKFATAESLYARVLDIRKEMPGKEQDSLEKRLLSRGEMLFEHFKQHGYKNVGVLKFLVSLDGFGLSDNVGPLNLLAARRLETALIFANDPLDPIGITTNASEVAAQIRGATHLSEQGREKLFSGQYPLAWGTDTVQLDAFVTGTIDVSRDLRTQTFTLYCIDRATYKMTQIGEQFQVETTIDQLADMGESFMPLTARDASQTALAKFRNRERALHAALKLHFLQLKTPEQDDNEAVRLDVGYDGKAVPVEFKAGKAFVQAPREGQTIQFGLRRDRTNHRYAVVLKVNGENSLDRQRLPDLSCKKWVLTQGKTLLIRGYHVGDNVQKFQMGSAPASERPEFNYFKDAGTITLTVFRERQSAQIPRPSSADEVYQMNVKNLAELPRRPVSLGALRAQFSDEAARNTSGGVVLEGQGGNSKIVAVPFNTDPDPIMTLTIVIRK